MDGRAGRFDLAVLSAGWQRWLLPALFFIGAAASGLSPVADGDIYWHLAAGREIVRRHALLFSDPFSVSAAGRPWIDVHWLFQLGVYAVQTVGGLSALVAVKCAIVGCGALLLYATVPARARLLLVSSQLAALLAVRQLLLMRPVIVSLLLMAACFLLLERFRRSGRPATLVWLPLLQVVWSNCQGLAALGPALVFAHVLAAWWWLLVRRRRWFGFVPEAPVATRAALHARALSLTLAACVTAWLLTPYGARGSTLSFELLHRLVPAADNPYAAVAENVSPLAPDASTSAQFWHLPWFLGWLALSYASCRRLLLSHLLLVMGFGALALLSNRNLLLLYWIAPPIAAMQLLPRARLSWIRGRGNRDAWIFSALSRAVVVGLLSLITAAASNESAFGKPVPFRFPTQSSNLLAGRDRPAARTSTIFCADQQGGYLIWRLYPDFRPYIDTRLVLRTPEQFSEYLALADQPERFEQFQQQHGFSYVVLPVAYPDRYLQLIAYLYRDPNWRLIFTDGSEVLFARRELAKRAWDLSDAALTEQVLSQLGMRYAAQPDLHDAALVQFGMLNVALGEFAQAERILSKSRSAAAGALHARALLAAGELDAAQALGERRARAEPDDVRNLVLIAMVYGRRGRLQQSLRYLRRALALDPHDPEALGLLSTLEELPHDH